MAGVDSPWSPRVRSHPPAVCVSQAAQYGFRMGVGDGAGCGAALLRLLSPGGLERILDPAILVLDALPTRPRDFRSLLLPILRDFLVDLRR